MTQERPSVFKIGDLVTGRYDYTDHLYYSVFGEGPARMSQHVGVVISVDHEMYYFGDYIYTVLCVDGTKRFFLEDELAFL